MNWEAIGAVGEILGALAVVATLFYLAVQIRQSTRLSQSQIQTELLALGHEVHNWKKSPEFAEVVVRANSSFEALSPAEKEQFETYVFQMLNIWEHAHGNHRRGLMSDSYWDAWNDTFHPNLAHEGWRGVWESAKPHFAEEFREHVDAYLTVGKKAS